MKICWAVAFGLLRSVRAYIYFTKSCAQSFCQFKDITQTVFTPWTKNCLYFVLLLYAFQESLSGGGAGGGWGVERGEGWRAWDGHGYQRESSSMTWSETRYQCSKSLTFWNQKYFHTRLSCDACQFRRKLTGKDHKLSLFGNIETGLSVKTYDSFEPRKSEISSRNTDIWKTCEPLDG